MPLRRVLSASQRIAFEAIPIAPDALVKYYTLTQEELKVIQKRRQASNRLGFALQLCLARYPGRILRIDEDLPQPFIDFIAQQVGTHAKDFQDYAKRETTRREHVNTLMDMLGLISFKGTHFKKMVQWLIPIAFENSNSVLLVSAVLNELRRKHILQPALIVIEKLVAQAQMQADKRMFQQVNKQLKDTHIALLDQWLIPQKAYAQSKLSWIRQPIGRPTPANVVLILERITAIDQLQLPKGVLTALPKCRVDQLAREGRKVAIHNLRTFIAARRYTIIAVALLDIRCSLIDEAITMHDQIIGGLIRRSQAKHTAQIQEDLKRTKGVLSTFATLIDALSEAKEKNLEAFSWIEQAIPWDRLQNIYLDAQELIRPKRLNHLYFVQEYYPQIRRYAPELIKKLDFQAADSGKDILEAVNILRALNAEGKRKLPSNIPTSWVSSLWKPLVFQPSGIDRRYYELCVLGELRNRLRSGDIWVRDSKQYKEFDSHLLGASAFAEMRSNDGVPLAVTLDCEEYILERIDLLDQRCSQVNDLLKRHSLEGIQIIDNKLSVSPYRGEPIPTSAKEFIQRVYAAMPRIKITDLLVEVNTWVPFTEYFTHLKTGLPAKEIQGLLTVILSEGINLGLTRMADASPGYSSQELSWIEDWYVRDECYSRALAELVNYHHSQELVNSWGDGTTSSSDGQHFTLGSVAKELGHINPKYGSRPGVIFYTHVSDQYTPFHTQLIHANLRDATFVLDGLLYHNTDLKIEEHYTDTTGFTDHIFGLCHLLGFRFAPRIRDIGTLRLYTPGDPKRWPELAGIFGERLKMHLINSHWEEILRLASSIRLGHVTASVIIRKLASYPRQNRLALALRELGRIERTLFILDWMQDSTLRARVQKGLNKGEARNALARAVFFNRLGEVRDRSFEGQCYRASGLNLIVSAIILWNTVQLDRVVKNMQKTQQIPEDYLAYLSPLGWDHINLTGDYVWSMLENP